MITAFSSHDGIRAVTDLPERIRLDELQRPSTLGRPVDASDVGFLVEIIERLAEKLTAWSDDI